jgi:hypothetical protein
LIIEQTKTFIKSVLTNYGEIDSKVFGARVEEVDAAPVDALVLGLDVFDSQLAGALRRAHEKGPQAESTRHGPVRPRLESPSSRIDAATESKTRFTTSLDSRESESRCTPITLVYMIEKAHLCCQANKLFTAFSIRFESAAYFKYTQLFLKSVFRCQGFCIIFYRPML